MRAPCVHKKTLKTRYKKILSRVYNVDLLSEYTYYYFIPKMFSKCVLFVILGHTAFHVIQGQHSDKFFRGDYTYIDSTKSFYKIHTLQKAWNDAKINCEREGAMFFYPEDEDEAEVVIQHWNETQPRILYVFIGIGDWNVPEVFDTVDGRPMSEVYNNWGIGEPNNAGGKEGCVILRNDGTLNDDDCHKRAPYICKKSLSTMQWNTPCNIPDQSYVFNKNLDRCYKFHLVPKNWTDAYAICHAEQSYLAIINSEMEAAHLVNITENAPKENIMGNYLRGAVHLGFKYSMDNWITTKGVPLHESGYNGWGYGQPDGSGNENCGSMFYNGQLNDIGCFQKMFFICEHEVPLRAEEIILRFNDSLE